MVPPAVRWSGQPAALVDEIECSFIDGKRQPAGHLRWQGAQGGQELPGSPSAQGEKSILPAKIDHPDADNVFMSNA
jgi:hypothetical protein